MDIIEKFLNSVSYKFPKGYPDMKNDDDILMLESLLTDYLGENIEIMSEVNLSPVQLEKPFPSKSEHAGKYNDRGERFLDKLIKGEEIELNDGNTVKIDIESSQDAINILKSGKYKELGGVKKLFKDIDGNLYSLSNFKKTKEFGSGSGQGAGTAATSVAESSQCVFASLAYTVKKGHISMEDLTDENFNKAFERCDVTDSLESIKSFSQDKSWANTLILSANTLFDYFKSSNFEFHKGSQFVQSIYNAYKIASKNEGLSMQSDKWNPADIWLVDKSILNFEFPTNLQELNAFLADMFSDNLLIGVSLKKVGKEAKLSIANISQEDKEGYTLESIDARPTNKGGQLNYNGGKIYFRTFNFATNFAGEILGKTAAHGKIGAGPLNDVLRYNKLPLLPHSRDVKSGLEKKDEDILNIFHKNYNIVIGEIDKDKFMELFESKDMDWKVSKFLALHITSSIKSSPQDIANEVISDIIRYASSATKSSSVFAKIS